MNLEQHCELSRICSQSNYGDCEEDKENCKFYRLNQLQSLKQHYNLVYNGEELVSIRPKEQRK